MRDDLLEAQAAVEWAIAQITVLVVRIEGWRQRGPYFAVSEPDSQPGKNLIRVREREPLPRQINAEAGAIINMIRSALDILTVALAERNGFKRPRDVYFPIAGSVGEFRDPVHGAIKKIKRLSDADRVVIENLKPYSGGDDCLWSLHHLDIMRKHQRLVGVAASPRTIGLFGVDPDTARNFLYAGKLEDGAPLFRVSSATKPQVDFRLEVTFNETPFADGRPVIATLRAFSARATEIIALFDT